MEGVVRELRTLVEQGMVKRWGKPQAKMKERLDDELIVIESVGCAAYFMEAVRLVAAIKERGGLIGPGRGACVGSAVCYALGLTDVDPLKYGLLFERFLNKRLKRPRAILIDVDAKGEWIAHSYLARFKWSCEERKQAAAPQFLEVEGVGELGLTRIPELNEIAETLDWLELAGRNGPVLSEIEPDTGMFGTDPMELRWQEDLMLLAQGAGMSAAESDRFMKAMTYRKEDEALKSKHLFADDLWERMWSIASELRMKAHAVACEKLARQVELIRGLREEIRK